MCILAYMNTDLNSASPGRVAFLGSGETALAGGQWFEQIASDLPMPLTIAVLETSRRF